MSGLEELASKIYSTTELTVGGSQYKVLNCALAAEESVLRCHMDLGAVESSSILSISVEVNKMQSSQLPSLFYAKQ